MVVVDTGALVALMDSSERAHAAVAKLYLRDPGAWIVPAAVLPEVDYILAQRIGAHAQRLWLADLADGRFAIEWGRGEDLTAACSLCLRYRSLQLGLVDALVMATAVRLQAAAIATLDLRHFGAVRLPHQPRLLPRDA
ncbi:MAG: type II toxin-antitoxin system VapC family toxin [Terriglobales bacterium]